MSYSPRTSLTPAPVDEQPQIELIISAKGLKDMDVFTKSDPMCIVWVECPDKNCWKEHGRTETIKNTLNPEFSKRIRIDYHFEQLQKLRFTLYDIDFKKKGLDYQDFLGEVTCSLGHIVSAGRLELALSPHGGRLFIQSQDVSTNKDTLELRFGAIELPKRGWIQPNAFMTFYRLSPGGQKTLIHRTEPVHHNRQPKWQKFTVPLCLFETEGEVLIECFNYKYNGAHKMIGQVQVNITDLLQATKAFALENPEKEWKHRGNIVLLEANPHKAYTFLDYVYGGTQLNCSFAIDFTASNGNPVDPNSLHYTSKDTPSQYEVALRSVGQIIQDYDSDKQFPVLGFGALVPPTNQLSHEFFVNLSPNPYCSGVDGVVDAYRKCVQYVTLHGPTNFAPIIRHVTRFAASYPDGGNYFILVILTCGSICDMNETKQALIDASSLPLSVVIVGIGDADFTTMVELDSDRNLLAVNGRTAQRDIVQFVAFNNYRNYSNSQKAGEALAKALLAEIPSQLVSYMNSKGIAPGRKFGQ